MRSGPVTATAELELVSAARDGDLEAFHELYETHVDAIHSYLARRVGRQQSEDLTAEVFVRVWRGLPTYSLQGSPFRAWLFVIARNLLASEYRRNRPLVVPLEEQHDWEHRSPQTGGPATESIDDERLLCGLGALSCSQRQVIEHRFLHDRSVAQTADALGLTEGAVRAQTFRALRSLRAQLADAATPDSAR